jgi:hypothetical protein
MINKLSINCPHCGKELPSDEKFAFHLAKECPGLAKITSQPVEKAPVAKR